MSDVPELTDDEATALRCRLMHPTLLAQADARITLRGLDDENAEAGRAVLAAYDAKKRAEIRAEAMRECEVEAVEQSSYRCGYCGAIVDAIREKIAKEQTNGQS